MTAGDPLRLTSLAGLLSALVACSEPSPSGYGEGREALHYTRTIGDPVEGDVELPLEEGAFGTHTFEGITESRYALSFASEPGCEPTQACDSFSVSGEGSFGWFAPSAAPQVYSLTVNLRVSA